MKLLKLLSLVVLLSACSDLKEGYVYHTNGQPEALLDLSAEIVNFDITTESSVDQIVDWIATDTPTRAEVYCTDNDPVCLETQDALYNLGVPFEYIAASDNSITLVYERVLTRDCESRYINNTYNQSNLNHPTFGCSAASNMVQMVTDKKQFVAPNLLDYPDAEKGVSAYEMYLERPDFNQQTRSVIEDISFD